MLFSYRCPDHGPFDLAAPVGKAPPHAECPVVRQVQHCGRLVDSRCRRGLESPRDFASEEKQISTGDPWRSWYLGSKSQAAESEQQRRIDAPRDNFERRHLEAKYDRRYVGNDTDFMRPAERAACKEWTEKKRAGELV